MKRTLTIEGMHCSSCAIGIETYLKMRGVKKVKVDYEAKKAEVEFDQKETKIDKIKKEIENLGYSVK